MKPDICHPNTWVAEARGLMWGLRPAWAPEALSQSKPLKCKERRKGGGRKKGVREVRREGEREEIKREKKIRNGDREKTRLTPKLTRYPEAGQD